MKVELEERECNALLSCMEYVEATTGKTRDDFALLKQKLKNCIRMSSEEALLINLVRGYHPKKP